MRLTHSPAIDNPSNTANVSGASASMMANCRRTAFEARATTVALFDDPALLAARITPTATNDSQKPADSGAKGSSSRTAISASAQVRPDACVPRREPCQRHAGEHEPGALCGHREPGQQRIRSCGGEPERHGERLTFDEGCPRQDQQPFPQQTCEEKGNQCEQRDVQSRDGDQMRRACRIEHAPLICAQPIGKPHCKRHQQRRGIRIGNLIIDARGHAGARAVDGRVCQRESAVEPRGQYPACEMHSISKREARGICACEISCFRKRSEAHQQAPAFAYARRGTRVAPHEPRGAHSRIRAVNERARDIEVHLRTLARWHRNDVPFQQHALVRRRR